MASEVFTDAKNFVKERHRENHRSRPQLKYRLYEIAEKLRSLFGPDRRSVAIGHMLPPCSESAVHFNIWPNGSDVRRFYFFEQFDELLFTFRLVVASFGFRHLRDVHRA